MDFGLGTQNPLMGIQATSLSPFGGFGGNGALPIGGFGAVGFGGSASSRCCGAGMMGGMMPGMMPGMGGMDQMLGQMMMMQMQINMMLMQLILQLLQGRGVGGGFGGGFPGMGGIGGFPGVGGVGGGGSVTDSGPIRPGTQGLLEHANRMVGMEEHRDRAAIQQVTGRSGINPATTPWCAAWAMNLLEQHGVMDLKGLSNRNYCPTIKSWSQGKHTWGENGRYTPKAGDAILFDWNRDGTPDHIGIVERVSGGRVYTIEGNSSDRVSKRSYALGQSTIDGYVRS